MNNSKMTKRALLTSVMALMLCFAMLTGTTFAWFTDQETSANNRIVAGNLDVDLLMYKDAEGKYVSIADGTTGDIFTEGNTANNSSATLWEPGKTQVAYLAIENKGTLDLKYRVELTVKDPNNGMLYKVMNYTITPGAKNGEVGTWTGDNALSVVPGKQSVSGEVKLTHGSTDYFALSIHMSEEAGNEYKNSNLLFDITVYATQLASEEDAFDNTYDAPAEYSEKITFDNQTDLLKFAPKAGDEKSSGLSLTADGKAQVDSSGAWYSMEANLLTNNYTVDYDLDITDLAAGEQITVDAGDSTTWGSTPIYIERGSAIIYYGTHKNELVGSLEGTVLHISHTYEIGEDGKLAITTKVSDESENSVEYTKSFDIENKKTNLYWDIFSVSTASVVTMDNFVETREQAPIQTAEQLAAAIEEIPAGGTFDMPQSFNTTDNPLTETIVIDKDITLNPNGMYLVSSADATFTIAEGGKLTVADGSYTIKNTATNGAAVFVDGGEFVMAGGSFDAHTAVKTAEGKSSTVTLAAGWSNRVTVGFDLKGNDTLNVTGGTLITSQESIITTGKTTINMSGGTLSGKPARQNMYNPSVVCNGETTIIMTGGKIETTANQSIAVNIINNSKIDLSGNAVISGTNSGIRVGGFSTRDLGDNCEINISGNANVTANGAGNNWKIGFAIQVNATNTTINVSENAKINGSSYGILAGQEGCAVNVSGNAHITSKSGSEGYGIGAPNITITGGTIDAKNYGVISDMVNSTVVIDNSTTQTPIKISGGTFDVYVHSTSNYTTAGNPEFDTFGTRS